jgi:peptide/nickel transport system permease protein
MIRVGAFMLRRAAAGVFTVWALVTIAFFVFWAIPNNEPAEIVYAQIPHHQLTNAQIREAHHLLGIDRPLSTQYGDYLWNLLHGDLGRAWQTYAKPSPGFPPPGVKIPIDTIRDDLSRELPVTLSIILGGALLVLLLAVPLGAIAGSRLRSLTDRTISLVALIGICTHPMVIGLILRGIFGDHLHWTSTGYCPITGYPQGGAGCNGIQDWAGHMVLPWITFALLFLALYTRMIRASVAETMPEDYVRTARAKGASEYRIMTRHVLPNASLRILTMIGMEIGTAIGVCVYIETAYNMGGLANASIQAMLGLDLPAILGVVIATTLIVVIGNLAVDALYAIIDPRIRFNIEHDQSKSLAGGVL